MIFLIIYGLMLLILANPSSGLTCLNCPDITHPRFCDHVRHCSSEEVCGVERIKDVYGDIRYKLGCFPSSVCSSSNRSRTSHTTTSDTTTGKCFQCCTSDLCNSYGCGETGVSNKNVKTCYKCNGNLFSDPCNTITFCSDIEMCYIEEGYRIDEKFYKSGCMESHICTSSLDPFGRRSIKRTSTNLRCCQETLCNSPYGSTYFTRATTPSGVFHTGMHLNTPGPTSSQHTHTSLPGICPKDGMCFNKGLCHTNQVYYTCVCKEGYFGQQCKYTDSKGTSFVLIFQKKNTPKAHTYPEVLVSGSGSVTKRMFASRGTETIQLSQDQYRISLNQSIFMEDGKFSRGVELISAFRTNMYGISYNNDTSYRYSSGYLAIPTEFLGTKYIVPTYYPQSSYYPAFIALTAIKPNTIVNIYLRTYKQITLNKYETFEISGASDYSGTLITATDPIILISGHINNYIASSSHSNPLVEMVLPVNQWDNVYIIPKVATHPTSTIRIYSNNATSFTIHYGDKLEQKQIAQRAYINIEHHGVSYLKADKDVLVMLYPHGLTDKSGDIFMMTIHGMNQYLSSYQFAVPDGFTSFVSITVPSDAVSGFVLDGKHVRNPNTNHIFGGQNHYSTFVLDITSGTHQMNHTSGVRFGLWVYGNGYQDAYGYPAGIAFKTKE